MINKFKSNRGQTLVEFALVLPLLLLLIFGIIEFSIIMYDKVVLTYASREGARAGIVFRADPNNNFDYSPVTGDQIRAAVSNYMQANGLVTFGVQFNPASDVTPQWSTDGGSTWTTTLPTSHGDGTLLKVDVAFGYTYLALPRIAGQGIGTLDLASRTIMRME